MKDYSSSAYAMSNAGLHEEYKEQIRLDNPTWDEDKVEKELDKMLKDNTLYHIDNKKPKKSEASYDEKKVKDK